MKPFNLEEFKDGRPAITREGKKAHFVAHEPSFLDNQRVCFKIDGGSEFVSCAETGRYYVTTGEHSYDLVGMAPVKRTVWVNVYKDHSAYYWSSKQEADRFAQEYRIGDRAWPLEIEE